MNKYEILLIFKPTFEADSMDATLKQVETVLTNAGGTILRTDRFGRKKLAYKISKVREGLMAVVAAELPPAAIKDINFNLKLNEELLRFTLLRNDDLDIEKPFMVTPVTGREPREAPRGGRGGGRFGDRRGPGGPGMGGGGRFGNRPHEEAPAQDLDAVEA